MTKLKKAVDTLRKALKRDGDLYYSYQSNIAMAFVDVLEHNGIKGAFFHILRDVWILAKKQKSG